MSAIVLKAKERSQQVKQSLDTDIAARERRIAEVRKSLEDREKFTESLRVLLQDTEGTIDFLKRDMLEQEQMLESLRQNATQREQQMASLQQRLDDYETDSAYKLALALTLANTAYDALFVLNESCQIVAINNGAESLFEVARPLGRSLADVTHTPELELMVGDALANAEETLEEQITIDGRSYRVRVQVIRRAGNAFIGLALQDVTELVRLHRARRDMVANISHELRTPIANIRLIIDSLFHEQDKPKRKQSTTALRTIARETDSLLWLVQELLDLSMIESGQAILRMVEWSVKELIEEAAERMQDQSEIKKIRIVSEAPDDVWVWADHEQARRVLINLIHNAIKWSPPGKVITVTAETAADEVIVSVLDQGPGVADDQKERIFERFYQVDPSRSGGEGTGLGLAICKHIIEAHGGRIWAESTNNGANGGIFRFTLGLAETHAIHHDS